MTPRRSIPLLAAILLVPMFGQAAFAQPSPNAIEIVSPRATDELQAGGTVLLEWRPRAEADHAAGADLEEWEVFLSLDGGEHFTQRLTPHLDRDVRSIRVDLPTVATPNARLLFRFGDEREESEVELGFDLVLAPALTVAQVHVVLDAEAPGEAARPGDAGVMQWTEGPRDGSRLVQRQARQGRFRAGQTWLENAASGIVELDDARRPEVSHPLTETGRSVAGDFHETGPRPAAGSRAVPVARRLAILSRRNE